MSFFDEALLYAQFAHNLTGVLTSVILAQWADETEYGTSSDWTIKHNPGNVSPDGDASYPTLQDGVDAYVQTMNNGDYNAVKSTVGWQGQCYALGRSPWAGAHYEADGGPPGQDLIKIILEQNLTQFDAPPPAPAPPVIEIMKPTSGRYGLIAAPVVAIAPMSTNDGYTLVGADGGTFNYGTAPFLGSLAGTKLAAPIVDAVHTPDDQGLILVGTDGGVFCFGTAIYHGSMGGTKLTAPIVAISVTSDGGGYWLTGADGGVFAFGNAPFAGSAG